MLAQTSSGIEPVFLLSYMRRRKVNAEDPSASVDFVDDMGDEWQEFPVYHHKFKRWMDVSGLKDSKLSPYHNSTASEIDWEQRIKMQAIVQKYVTHSISSTVNLPSDTSLKRVSEIYMESWKKGLKGVTVYRDGSRAGVLISTDTAQKEINSITENHAPSRPKKIEAKIIRFQNDYEKWVAVVGLLNGKPYEIFTGKTEDTFFIPKSIDTGWIIKSKNEDGSSRYDFQFADKENYKITFEGLSRSFNKEFWNYAKLISGVLRHGMPLHYAVELVSNLHLYDENINTWKNGVVRALKTFIPDGTMVTDKTCSECNSESLIYEEGCLKCVNCGYSKCG
jgi:ribonucleoside-diphosphate reductase alpha chain